MTDPALKDDLEYAVIRLKRTLEPLEGRGLVSVDRDYLRALIAHYHATTRPLADEKLRRLEELEKAATPGPWRAGRPDMTSYDGNTGYPFKQVYCDDKRAGTHEPTGEQLPYTVARGEGDECHENAQLIAALRNAAPRLLEMAREIEGDNGLRASKDAAWEIARGRLELIEKLESDLTEARQKLAEAEGRIVEIKRESKDWRVLAEHADARGVAVRARTFRECARQIDIALSPPPTEPESKER